MARTTEITVSVADAPKVKQFIGDIAGRLAAVEVVLADRERELLDLKGPCSTDRCRLHYAHSGPCDVQSPRP